MEGRHSVKLIIFDLDGTLTDASHRVPLAKQKRWDEYTDACVDDTPRLGPILLYKFMDKMTDYPVCIVTGRQARVVKETRDWLEQYGMEFPNTMVMREDDDRSKNVDLKRRAVKHLQNVYSVNSWDTLLVDDHPDAEEALSDICRVLPVRSHW